jgi:AhpD family alkylhydroperoxidase
LKRQADTGRGRFNQRFYTPRAFLGDLANAIRHLPDLRAAARGRRVSRSFAEKIMMVVTQVNGCRYCSYFHTRLALSSGVSDLEIERLLALEIGAFPVEEAVALAFAQHFAESKGRPDPEAERRFREYYGPDMARDILSYIRMITVGNLAGNTVDAFLSRLRGRPAEGSSAAGEFLLFLLFAPFTLPLLGPIRRQKAQEQTGL